MFLLAHPCTFYRASFARARSLIGRAIVPFAKAYRVRDSAGPGSDDARTSTFAGRRPVRSVGTSARIGVLDWVWNLVNNGDGAGRGQVAAMREEGGKEFG